MEDAADGVARLRIGSSSAVNTSEPGVARVTVGLSSNPGNIKLIIPSRPVMSAYLGGQASSGAGDNGVSHPESIQLVPSSGPSRQYSAAGTRHGMLELHIGLSDLTHITVPVDRSITATELMDTIIENLQLNPPEAKTMLSLWLMSEDLEVQLKPNHCPISLFAKWPVYLKRYTQLPEEVIRMQTPQLLLRRNVYMTRDADLQVNDVHILQLLYYEARCNVMEGTYPSERDVILKLAGDVAVIGHGPYDELKHTHEFYKNVSLLPLDLDHKSSIDMRNALDFYHREASDIPGNTTEGSDAWYRSLYRDYLATSHEMPYYGSVLSTFVPPYLHDKISKCHNLIDDIMAAHRDRSTEQPSDTQCTEAYHRYISTCAENFPLYGSAFFTGFIERPHKSFFKNSQLPVNIGLNTYGVYIINSEKNEPIFGVSYEHLTWEFINVCECTEEACEHNSNTKSSQRRRYSLKQAPKKKGKQSTVPSILLQHAVEANNVGKPVKFIVLRVYTSAARLIDAFIDNCSEMMKQRLLTPVPSPAILTTDADLKPMLDMVDGITVQANRPTTNGGLEKATREMCKLSDLKCQHFDADGVCLDSKEKGTSPTTPL